METRWKEREKKKDHPRDPQQDLWDWFWLFLETAEYGYTMQERSISMNRGKKGEKRDEKYLEDNRGDLQLWCDKERREKRFGRRKMMFEDALAPVIEPRMDPAAKMCSLGWGRKECEMISIIGIIISEYRRRIWEEERPREMIRADLDFFLLALSSMPFHLFCSS